MKNSYLVLLLLVLLTTAQGFSQKKEQKLYDKYQVKLQERNYPEALSLLDKFILKFPESKSLPDIYFKKGSIHVELGNTDAAIGDFTMAYEKDQTFKEAVRMRGNLYYKQDKLAEALSDYNLAILIDSTFADAYSNKALVYKKQSLTAEACENFQKSLQYGYVDAYHMICKYCDSTSATIQRYLLKSLTTPASDDTYGFSEKNPVKIGMPVQREKLYLSMLRDSKGEALNYKRMGSCCAYRNTRSTFGMALCDRYELEVDGKIKSLYISVYDYEEPKIPQGLQSVSELKK
jgi:tetratricopeptide (TPR) repeat protein